MRTSDNMKGTLADIASLVKDENMRHEPIRALACQYIHLYDYLFQWLSRGPKTDPTAIQSPTKNHLYHLDKQNFIFLNVALLKITISRNLRLLGE